MSGNVWDWIGDWYDDDDYSISPGIDPGGPSTGDYRVNRGGSWNNSAAFVRVANRGSREPDKRYESLGFRLARTSP